jgi:hypothetical protein
MIRILIFVYIVWVGRYLLRSNVCMYLLSMLPLHEIVLRGIYRKEQIAMLPATWRQN